MSENEKQPCGGVEKLSPESIEQIELILEIDYSNDITKAHMQQYLQELYDFYKQV